VSFLQSGDLFFGNVVGNESFNFGVFLP
jgi:hypothetical protein